MQDFDHSAPTFDESARIVPPDERVKAGPTDIEDQLCRCHGANRMLVGRIHSLETRTSHPMPAANFAHTLRAKITQAAETITALLAGARVGEEEAQRLTSYFAETDRFEAGFKLRSEG